jgi:hypothetical protein
MPLPTVSAASHFQSKENMDMGDKGKRDKGGREQRKKPALTLKEKRKLKQEKKK